MVCSDKDKILIKQLYQLKEYKVTELINEFLNEWWTKSGINRMLNELRDTSAVNTQVVVHHEVPH